MPRFDLIMIVLRDSVLILKSLMYESVRTRAAGPLYRTLDDKRRCRDTERRDVYNNTRASRKERARRNGKCGYSRGLK